MDIVALGEQLVVILLQLQLQLQLQVHLLMISKIKAKNYLNSTILITENWISHGLVELEPPLRHIESEPFGVGVALNSG